MGNTLPLYSPHEIKVRGCIVSNLIQNLALEKVMREMRGVEGSQLVDNDNSLRLLGFVDDHRELFSRHSQCIKDQNHEMVWKVS